MIVGGLFLVIILFQQARQPEKWRWLTGEAPVSDDADLDTRVRTIDEGGSGDLPGTIVARNMHFRPDAELDDEARAQRRAEKDIWKQQLEALSWAERREVARVLKAVRDNQPLTDEQAAGWKAIMGILDDRWATNIAEARDVVAMETRLSEEDKAAWLHILHNLQKQWDDGLKHTLTVAADPTKLTDEQRVELKFFEQLYDEMAMEEIRDDTVASRPNDTAAWFRLAENLSKASAEDLANLDEQAAPAVGFRQLFQQPADYRGKLVRVSGAARLVYRVPAPRNILGIEHYYIFYVQPAGGPTSPLVVYTTELPPGFPQVEERGFTEDANEMNEAVEFVGYFFKKMAYQDEYRLTRVAPLLIAKSPIWTPREVRSDPMLPDWRIFLAVAAGLAVMSAGIAAFVYWRHRGSPMAAYGPAARATPQQLTALKDQPVLPSPAEALAEMAQRDSQG
jgi:hypothetical protein